MEELLIKALSRLAAIMQERGQDWREECERNSEMKEFPALFLQAKNGSYLVKSGEPPAYNPPQEEVTEEHVVSFFASSSTVVEQLLRTELSPQAAVHAGELRIDGDSEAALFLSQLMAEAWEHLPQ